MIIILLALIGISVHGIFLFKREILYDKRKFKVLLISSAFLVGLFYLIRGLGVKIKAMEMLAVPFFALLTFWIMSTIYRVVFNEEAKDSFHTMDLGLMKDGIFNFLFWVIGLLLPIYISFKVL